MNKKYRLILLGVMILLLLAGVLSRIMQINKDLHIAQTKTYEMGQMVKLERDYFLEEYEIAEDYAVTVEGASVKSCEEFLTEYGYEGTVDELFPVKSMTYPEMVYVVDVTIENIGTEKKETGINLSYFELVATDYKLQISDELYTVANPQIENGSQMFQLRPQSKILIHLPYYFSVSYNYSYLTVQEVLEDDIYLVLSVYPTKKQVMISC